jgi:hypothetical protein
MPRFVVAILVLFAYGYGSDVDACSCVGPGPACAVVWSSDVVFVGRAEAGASVGVAHFTVERSVRGLEVAELELANGPGNCAYPFKPGERYVVYAYRNPQTNQISTNLCTRTRPANNAVEDLAYFEEMTRPSTGARVYGRIRHIEMDYTTGRPIDYGPITRVTLTLTGGDEALHVATDTNGQFEFAHLKPGAYRFTATLPTPFVPWPSVAVALDNDRTCIQMDSVARLDGRIRGRVLREDGRPEPGVRVEASAARAIDGNGQPRTVGAVSNQDGTFEIGPLPVGVYLVGTELSSRLLPRKLDRRRYYPGVRDRAAAVPVHLDAGAQVQLRDFRLPALPTDRTIEVVVRDSDGNLVPGATVTLYGARQEDHTTPDGRISFTLPYGAYFNVSARLTREGKVVAAQAGMFAAIDRNDGDGIIELRLRIP